MEQSRARCLKQQEFDVKKSWFVCAWRTLGTLKFSMVCVLECISVSLSVSWLSAGKILCFEENIIFLVIFRQIVCFCHPGKFFIPLEKSLSVCLSVRKRENGRDRVRLGTLRAEIFFNTVYLMVIREELRV
jgi:hypothetical protein